MAKRKYEATRRILGAQAVQIGDVIVLEDEQAQSALWKTRVRALNAKSELAPATPKAATGSGDKQTEQK